MGDDKKQKQDSPPPSREPLIVEVPTVLTRIDVQLRAQGTTESGSSSGSGEGGVQQRS